jgi:hypothetical protein
MYSDLDALSVRLYIYIYMHSFSYVHMQPVLQLQEYVVQQKDLAVYMKRNVLWNWF